MLKLIRPHKVFYGWWIVLAYCAINFYWGGTLLVGFTALFIPIKSTLGLSATTTTLAIQLRSITSIAGAPIVGYLFDKVGPRPIMLTSAIITGGGLLLLSFASTISTFFSAFFIMSIGFALWSSGTGPATAATWFIRHKGKATAVALAGVSLGGVLVPAIVWMEQTWDWRTSVQAIVVGMALFCIPLSLILRHRPEQYGLLPDGASPDTTAVLSPIARAGIENPSLVQLPEATRAGADSTLQEALHTPTLWFLCLAQFWASMGTNSLLLFFIPHLEHDVGITPATAGVALTVMAILSFFGQFLFGWGADNFNKRLILAVSYSSGAVGLLLFALVQSPWQLVPFVVIYGVGARAIVTVTASILADYFGRSNFGKIQGVVLSGFMAGGLVGPLMVAGVFDVTGSYAPAFLAFAGLSGLAVLALVWATPPNRGGKVQVQRS